MKTHSTRTAPIPTGRIALLFGLTLASACGNLDEQDSSYPSVLALTRWDATHVLAVRGSYPEPVVLDLATGKQTGKLGLGKYYQDIESLGDGAFVARHNQSIDYLESDGRIKYSVPGHVLIDAVVSADRSTLAYADYMDAQESFIGVTSLQPTTVSRYSLAGLHFDLKREGLALSRDGTLLAYLQSTNVGLARTDGPHPAGDAPTVPTCNLDQGPDLWGVPIALAISPVDDKLAVLSSDGLLRIFDLAQYPNCPMLVRMPAVTDDTSPFDLHLRYSPNGAILAVSVSRTIPDHASAIQTWINEVRLFDANTGAAVGLLPVGREEAPIGDSGARLIDDMQWSDAGDQLTVAGQFIFVQHWDVATTTLLWSTKL